MRNNDDFYNFKNSFIGLSAINGPGCLNEYLTLIFIYSLFFFLTLQWLAALLDVYYIVQLTRKKNVQKYFDFFIGTAVTICKKIYIHKSDVKLYIFQHMIM